MHHSKANLPLSFFFGIRCPPGLFGSSFSSLTGRNQVFPKKCVTFALTFVTQHLFLIAGRFFHPHPHPFFRCPAVWVCLFLQVASSQDLSLYLLPLFRFFCFFEVCGWECYFYSFTWLPPPACTPKGPQVLVAQLLG